MNIGKELTYALLHSPMTKSKIAKKTMLTMPTVKRVLEEPERCRFESVVAVAEALGVEITIGRKTQ